MAPLRKPPSPLRRVLALALLVLPLGAATPQEFLRLALEGRYLGDRTGVCLAAALVGDTTVEAFMCADGRAPGPLDAHTPLEIGALSRTLVSAVLQDMVAKGEVSLADPLAKFLPKSVKVPAFQGQPITLGQLAGHRAGLPSLPGRLKPGDGSNPYAALTEADLLGSLEDVQLQEAPGTRQHASHFGMMLLSLALARHAGQDFPALLRERVFQPLAMADAGGTAKGAAPGHASTGRGVAPWDFPAAMTGAGGLRASITDMAHFVEGQLGRRPSAISAALLATQGPEPMNWSTLTLAGRTYLYQEGATGGFTAFMALDPARRQGVVILADTALANVGGLGAMGLSLLDSGFPPPGFPRRPMPAGSGLLDGLVGVYTLKGGPQVVLDRKGDRLQAQFPGQAPVLLTYDTAGDFYGAEADFALRPVRTTDGYTFVLREGGGQVKADKIQSLAGDKKAADAAALRALAGTYKLSPAFAVVVTARDGGLVMQGTGQPETPVEAVKEDVYLSRASGVVFTFKRNKAGQVEALLIKQGSRTEKAERQ